ncbi:hypothetical protein DVH24_025556 [Malus domestica]|uniref:Divinyl chlorophyllide a 8-vinyl-reductase, chloroplastic n=1 Tax=Malus domestica TaxID=3750 RepID=A0A498HR31_MALDO|nr:hypothetical protein DVH24_025556 [Malus domestica]
MSLCFSSLVFNLHAAKNQSFITRLSSHFPNQTCKVSSVPSAFSSSSPLNLPETLNFIKDRLKPISASSNPVAEVTNPPSFRGKNPKDINILVVGATGYIGKFVVKELVSREFNVIAIAREKSGIRGKVSKDETLRELNGANVCFSDVTNLGVLEKCLENLGVSIDVVVSCLASRSGGVKDSWKIDYEATKNSLVAGRKRGASHFVLLSAICVQKPLLEFQRAKLKFESELIREAEESLGGQVELVKDGKPYVMFGDGKLCACKPISEADLASFIADCVLSENKINQVLPIGGPGKALTPLEQGELLFRLVGREPKFLKVPIEIMDCAIGVLDFLVKIFPSMEDTAEFGKIGRYYAAESMLVLDPETGEYNAEKTLSYGKDTLEEFFETVLREGIAETKFALRKPLNEMVQDDSMPQMQVDNIYKPKEPVT